MMRRWIINGLALGSALLAAGAAAAQSGEQMSDEDAIEYRQAVYKVIGVNFKPMGAMVEGKREYDPELFARNAQRVAQLSDMALEGFKGGPHQGDTEALGSIWDQWGKYRQGVEQFQEQAQTLASMAEASDWGAIREQFVQVADTCKTCHDNFREE